MILWNRILLAVDAGPASLEAVKYLAAVLGGSDNCRVQIVAVHNRPPSGNYADDQGHAQTEQEVRLALEARLQEAKDMLLATGIPGENLSTELALALGRSVGETIVALGRHGGVGTIVVGRRALSKAEEFLFGSVSNTVFHNAQDCCIWVVA